jgi:hypothetical protein
MKPFLLCAALAALAAIALPAGAGAPGVALIGHYSNMVASGTEEPHYVSGYDVDLYSRKQRAFGTMAVANGSPEPVGTELKDVVFDPATKQLRFRADYSDGREYSKNTGPDGRDTRLSLHFAGTVAAGGVTGVVTIKDAYCGSCRPVTNKVFLKRTSDTYVP